MRERSDCTSVSGRAPAVPGEWVAIFVGDEHPLLRLKQALDWAAITRREAHPLAGGRQNVDGGPGRRWPVA